MSFLSTFQDFSLIIFCLVFTLPWCATNEFLLYHGSQQKKQKKSFAKLTLLQIVKKSWFWKIIFLCTHTLDMKCALHTDNFIFLIFVNRQQILFYSNPILWKNITSWANAYFFFNLVSHWMNHYITECDRFPFVVVKDKCSHTGTWVWYHRK